MLRWVVVGLLEALLYLTDCMTAMKSPIGAPPAWLMVIVGAAYVMSPATIAPAGVAVSVSWPASSRLLIVTWIDCRFALSGSITMMLLSSATEPPPSVKVLVPPAGVIVGGSLVGVTVSVLSAL